MINVQKAASTDSKVVVHRFDNALIKCMDALGVATRVSKLRRVFIKANMRAAAVDDCMPGAITDVGQIEVLADFLIDCGVSVTVGECTSSERITEKALIKSGLYDLSHKIKVVNLNREPVVRVSVGDRRLKYLFFPKPVVETDFLISFAVMKTHSITDISLGLKNMMGATSEYMPARIHLKGLERSIGLLNRTLRPDLTIIDATVAMEGTGPVNGSPVPLDTVLASYDPVAVDTVGTRMMGFDPYKIEHITEACRLGVGGMEPVEIEGDVGMKKFRPSRHNLLIDLYNYRLFNLLMSRPPIHRFFYSTAYDSVKKILRVLNPSDRSQGIER